MNSTKLLCRLFDGDKKGYVTIGDIAKDVCVVACVCFAAYLMWLFAHGALTDTIVAEGWLSIAQFVGFIVWIGAFIYWVLWAIINVIPALMKIRVATCEFKKKEDK